MSADYWDDQADTFDEEADHGLRDPQVREAWRRLLLAHLPAAPAAIADIGCGTGSLSVLLAGEGYAVFYLTGRPQTQEDATRGNLTSDGVGVDAGYPAPTTLSNGEDGLFTKPAVADYPDYLKTACAAEIAAGKTCTTVHYKSATRAHIESLGYEIVGNFGDQFSDLEGGHADRTFKLPNPNYFLP